MKRVAINTFLIFHLVVIICWAMPLNSQLVAGMRPTIAPYMAWSGLAQGWNLFAPNPLGMNTRSTAEIKYRDGQTGIWAFPLPQNFGYFKRYFMEREHKFGFDSLLNDRFPDNPPVSVTLVSYRSAIAPPGSGLPEPWVRKEIFTYTVTPGDLQ
jgi:hypothetical protein